MSNLETDIFADGFLSDEDASLKVKGSSVRFGLNTGKLTRFEYTETSGKDKNKKAIEIEITVGERVFKVWLNEIDRVFGKDGEITDKNSEEYVKAYKDALNTIKGVITHYLKIFYTEDDLKNKIKSNGINTLVDYFKFASAGVNAAMKTKGNDVDVFLQYQYKKSIGQKITFLEMTQNLKYGAFICKAIKPVGEWTEVRDAEGLSYKDREGNIHKFKRDVRYLDTKMANQQKEEDDDNTSKAGEAMNGSTNSSQTGW